MNWLQDIISKFSIQGLAVVGLAYFRDIGKGGVRTVTITNRDGEITPVALNEDYNGYIRAINNANYRLREAIDCTANLYDVEQDVAIVMWLDRKVNPNGVMVAIQQAVAGNDILNTTFDKQVILNEEGLPENDYLMLKVVVRMVSEYAGSSCPADVCAVYYDPCFEVPSRPEPSDECDCECTVNSGECCDYSVEGIDLFANCFTVTFPEDLEFNESLGGFVFFSVQANNYPFSNYPTLVNTANDVYVGITPTIEELLEALEANFNSQTFWNESNPNVFTFERLPLGFKICYSGEEFLSPIRVTLNGAHNQGLEPFFLTVNSSVFILENLNDFSLDTEFDLNIPDNIFQVLINSTWTDVTDEVIDGVWTRENVCDGTQITEWRIIDAEDNVIDSGNVTANCTGTEETKTICEWITDHEERIQALEDTPSVGLTCETLSDCSDFTYVKDLAESAVQPDDLAEYVPYTGATADVDLGDNQLTTDAVTFDATPTTAAGERVLRWNDTDGTLDLGMKGGNVTQQIGMEQYVHAKSASNSGITEGYIYYLAGATGGNKLVELAQANTALTSKSTIGLATETVSGGNKAFITTFGLVRGLPDALFTSVNEGDTLYLSASTPGVFVNTVPTQPNHRIRIGYCVRKQSNNNEIFVSVQLGLDLGELCNVYAPTPANGYFPAWVTANSRYELQEPKFRFLSDLTNTAVNTNSTNNVLGSVLIPANTVTNNTILEVETWISRATGGANPGHRLFINTSNVFAGATQIANIAIGTTILSSKGERSFICKTGTIRGFAFTIAAAIDDAANTNAVSQASVDWTVNQYILTVANNATGETTTHELTSVKVIKP